MRLVLQCDPQRHPDTLGALQAAAVLPPVPVLLGLFALSTHGFMFVLMNKPWRPTTQGSTVSLVSVGYIEVSVALQNILHGLLINKS